MQVRSSDGKPGRACFRGGWDDLIADATTSDDADSSKPAPDTVEMALKKLDLPATEVIMIGDTRFDIESAARAHVGVIAVRTGGFGSEVLQGALAIYDSPADTLAHFDESPFGSRQVTV